MIKPIKPNKVPQMDKERRMMAGFRPIAFPIIRGVRYKSCIHCTTQRTRIPDPKISQKFSPPAEIAVHAVFDIVGQPLDKRTVTFGDQADPAVDNPFVIQQDKDEVEEDYKHDRDTEQDGESIGQHDPHFGSDLFDRLFYVLFAQELCQLVRIDIFFQVFRP